MYITEGMEKSDPATNHPVGFQQPPETITRPSHRRGESKA